MIIHVAIVDDERVDCCLLSFHPVSEISAPIVFKTEAVRDKAARLRLVTPTSHTGEARI